LQKFPKGDQKKKHKVSTRRIKILKKIVISMKFSKLKIKMAKFEEIFKIMIRIKE
jgi:hypothetical protein